MIPKIKIPAKLILFGEHFVLNGKKAIALAINRFGTARSDLGCKVVDPEKTVDFSSKFPLKEGMQINLDVRLGSGLGTSAIISIFLAQIGLLKDLEPSNEIINLDNKSTDKILNRALQIENIFHGVSSGLDVTASFVTGMILYGNFSYKRLDTCFIENYKLIIFDSKIMKDTKSANCHLLMTDEMVNKYEKIADDAERLIQSNFALNDLYSIIRRNQDLLDEMGIVPEKMKNEIVKLRERGIESKITGAGNGGYLVTLVNKDVKIESWEEVSICHNKNII